LQTRKQRNLKDFGAEIVAEEAVERLVSANHAVSYSGGGDGGGLLFSLSVLGRVHRRSSLGQIEREITEACGGGI